MASRIARLEERRERKRLFLSVLGMLAVLSLLILFGTKLIIGFSLFVDQLRGISSQPATEQQALLIPPTLNPLPEATNSGNLTVTGSAQSGMTLVLYVSDTETKKITIGQDGNFSLPINLTEGTNTISAKIVDDKGNTSNLSNIVTVLVKKSPPNLEVTEPADGGTVSGDNKTISVKGRTDEGVNITINGRFVIVSRDGSFQTKLSISEGENTIMIIAVDSAGNQTIAQKKITYHP